VVAWAAIDTSGGQPLLAIGCSKSEYPLCQQIPGCNFQDKHQVWAAPLTWPAYVAFKEAWKHQPVIESPGLLDWAASAWGDTQIAYGLRSAMDTRDEQLALFLDEADEHTAPVELGDGTVMPRKLFGYQRAGVAWLATQKRVILGDPQGNGKTPQVIRAIQFLSKTALHPGPALVICTGAMLHGWAREFAAWAPELRVKIITGTATKRRKIFTDAMEADVFLITWPVVRYHTRLAAYPGLAFTRCDEHGGHTGKTPAQCEVHDKELNAIPFSIVVADEAHRMKDAKAKQSRAVWHLMHAAEFAWPVTGTPIADSIADLWSVLHGVDPRAFPAKGRFLDLYAVIQLDWNQGREVLDLRPDTAPSFHLSVQPLIRRIPREVARPYQPPRLPPLFRYPEMEPAQARAYKQVAKELMADLGTEIVTMGSHIVKFSRLCQLAAAMIKADEGEDPYGFTKQLITLASPSNKVTDIMEFLSDNPGPLVVAANSPQLIELAGTRMTAEKMPWSKVTGGMSDYDKDQAVQAFQAGHARVIFITKAGGEGITLTRASAIYFAQPDPSFLSREQKIGRVDRIGQLAPVQPVYAITPGTVEVRLYELGCEKAERSESVVRDPDLIKWILGGDDGGIRAGHEAGAAV
jgi:SNF2 family DNA or RNA helicase